MNETPAPINANEAPDTPRGVAIKNLSAIIVGLHNLYEEADNTANMTQALQSISDSLKSNAVQALNIPDINLILDRLQELIARTNTPEDDAALSRAAHQAIMWLESQE